MASLLDTHWDAPLVTAPDDPAWEAQVRRALGSVPIYTRYLAPLPWLRGLALDSNRLIPTAIDRRTLGLVHLISAQENACRYCYGNARTQLRMMGFDAATLDRIEADAQLAMGDPVDRAVMGFARNLARSSPRPARAEAEALLRAGLSEAAVRDVAFQVSFAGFGNRVSTCLSVPVEAEFEALPDTLVGRLLRPVLSWWMTRSARPLPDPGQPPPPGPFSGVVGVLGPTAAAWVFHEALQGAFDSDVLPRRTKYWMFLVIARTMDCVDCLEGSKAGLRAEGVTEAELDEVLDTLSSDGLDDTERLLLPWARETVRYRSAALQSHTRDLATRLTELQLLEAIGVAALANASVRLAMLLR